MTKYSIPDDQDEEDEAPPEWEQRTSATIDMEVTLHADGYQTDRRWTVHVRRGHRDHPVAVYAGEHQNKGNYWRDPVQWRDYVDFVDLPNPVRKRVASMLNRSVESITEERIIRREDGRGVADLAGDTVETCEVCGGGLHGDADGDRHEECRGGDLDV